MILFYYCKIWIAAALRASQWRKEYFLVAWSFLRLFRYFNPRKTGLRRRPMSCNDSMGVFCFWIASSCCVFLAMAEGRFYLMSSHFLQEWWNSVGCFIFLVIQGLFLKWNDEQYGLLRRASHSSQWRIGGGLLCRFQGNISEIYFIYFQVFAMTNDGYCCFASSQFTEYRHGEDRQFLI
jgi:hypothetical protein